MYHSNVSQSIREQKADSAVTLAAALQQEVGLHVVESIPRTAEVIAAGRLGPDGGAVLVHAKLHAQSGSADCLIKCNDNVLAQHLSQHLAKTLRR
jgi:hypothetical protein